MKYFLIGFYSFAVSVASAADINGDVVNAPQRIGNSSVISISGSGQAGIGGISGQVGGANVDIDTIRADKGSKTGASSNSAKTVGNLNVISTGNVTAGSIAIETGAKTGNVTNSSVRNGDVNVYSGGISAQRNLSGVTASLEGGVVIDSVKVCAGTNARNITNAPRTTGKTTIIGSNVNSGSVVLGC